MLAGHPIVWILVAAVLAPLLAEIPVGFKVPVVVLEVVLGILIGPHVLHLIQFDGFVETMFTIGMAMTLFVGGMEVDFGEIRGRPLFLAVGGWTVSLLLGVTFVELLHAIPHVRAVRIRFFAPVVEMQFSNGKTSLSSAVEVAYGKCAAHFTCRYSSSGVMRLRSTSANGLTV
jgi:Kef-type K+ transport system membrane component KefB